MAKHLTKEQWIEWFNKYEYMERNLFWIQYLKGRSKKNMMHKSAKNVFKRKYKLWKEIGHNMFMKKIETRGKTKSTKRTKAEISKVVDQLTEQELKDVANEYFREKEEGKKKKFSSNFNWTNARKAFAFGMHRTTFYKKPVIRKYKYDLYNQDIIDIFNENHCIYGSKRISAVLDSRGVTISPRTIRNIMNRLGLATTTRQRRQKRENKDIHTYLPDLVKRNFNPVDDNILATDVSYIPANEIENNVYLSVAISHKTKKVESFKLSKINDKQLVLDTIKPIKKRSGLIIHSDHGSQYSSGAYEKLSLDMGFKRSMSRVGNSLDNREVEYFFSNIKSEWLKRINTKHLKLNEIEKLVGQYINWYNSTRIQSRLNWKTPASASVY